MLLGLDVFNVEREEWSCGLRQLAIFAPIAGAPTDKPARSSIHLSRMQETASLGLHQRDKMEGRKILIVFHSLGFIERAMICLLRQLVDAVLQGGIRPKIDNLSSCFRG
jgi:hypothetical protein